MTINNAELFFAWDVLSWLFVAMALAIVIVLTDLLLSKKNNQINAEASEKTSKIGFVKFRYIY